MISKTITADDPVLLTLIFKYYNYVTTMSFMDLITLFSNQLLEYQIEYLAKIGYFLLLIYQFILPGIGS